MFAWYQLAGSFATAAGTLAGGAIAQAALAGGAQPADAYRLVIVGYALVGIALAGLFALVSPRVEVPPASVQDETIRRRLGRHRSRGVVARL